MHKNPRYTLLAITLALCLPAAVSGKPPPTATVAVDCTDPDPRKHDSINAALTTPAHELTIEISGVCEEDVEIRRDSVTLLGADPMVDGIRSIDAANFRAAAIYVRNSRFIRIENLKLTGSVHAGVRFLGSDTQSEIVNCRLEGNQVGAVLTNSVATIEDTVITGNLRGLTSGGSSQLFCTNCTIEADAGSGALVGLGAQLNLTNSTVSVSGFGVLALQAGAVANLSNTTVDSPGLGLVATRYGEINLMSGASFSGALLAEEKSLVTLNGADQTANPLGFNILDLDSTARLTGGSSLLGPTFIEDFSKLLVKGSSTHDGDLLCSSAGDAFCDDPTTQVTGTSDCGQCPKP